MDGIPGSWAADVIKLKDGKYRFYYNFCGIRRTIGPVKSPP
jgi:hypothetical protein